MRSLKLGLAATAMICALSATAQAADCVKVAVAGETLTHDLAVLFSTNGLKNIMAGQGRVGQGPVRTTCKAGSGDDDVSLLADGVQSDNSQDLLGRLALPPHVTPLLGASISRDRRSVEVPHHLPAGANFASGLASPIAWA